MSVKDRITDAKVLYANGRKEGALLSVLVAVAATSRKRYPRGTQSDGDAFKSFLAEELPKITPLRHVNVKFRNKMTSLQDLLYKFVRCNLAHEAVMPEDIIFEKGDSLKVRVDDNKITFSDCLIDVLATIVGNAKENSDEFNKSICQTNSWGYHGR